MSKDVSILWGLVSIKNGADSPTVDKSYLDQTAGPWDINSRLLSSVHSYFNIGTDATILKAVKECPQVATIVFRKAQAHCNGITTLTQPNGKPLRAEAKQWQRVIDKPNSFTNRTQYINQLIQFLETKGYCWEYKEIGVGSGPETMNRRILNPHQCEVIWKKTTLFYVTRKEDLIDKFYYTENGIRTEIKDKENLYAYVNPNITAVNNGYLPESPLTTLTNPINASIANYKSRIRGISAPWGYVSNDSKDAMGATVPLPKEKAELLQSYQDGYGTADGKSEIVFVNHAVSFTAVMPPVAALQLLELLKSDSATICDVMGWEYDLLARDLGGVALNNKNEANKIAYQNHIIPQRKNIDEQEMESLGAAEHGFIITTDFSHLPVLQADQKAMSEALRNNVQSLILGFKSNQFSYNDMVIRAGVSELPQNQFTGKWWCDLSDEEKDQFENSNSNNDNNQDTNGQGNQGNQSGQGQNN